MIFYPAVRICKKLHFLLLPLSHGPLFLISSTFGSQSHIVQRACLGSSPLHSCREGWVKPKAMNMLRELLHLGAVIHRKISSETCSDVPEADVLPGLAIT